MKKTMFVLVVAAALVAALALTGCSAKMSTPAAPSISVAQPAVVDTATVEAHTAGDLWDEFQKNYELAKLDAANGGTVLDRQGWDYWASVPFQLQDLEEEDSAVKAAKFSLDILKRSGQKPSDLEGGASDLMLLAGQKAK